MNILIVKLSAIGDVVHTLPALNRLRRHYPDARITWLVEEAAVPLLKGHSALDRLLVSRRKTWMRKLRYTSSAGGALREMRTFLAELRDTRYDMVLDFQGLLKSGLLIALCRGRRKIGFDRGMEHQEHSYLFLNQRVPAISMEIHALVRSLQMLSAIGIPASEENDVEYGIPVTEEDEKRAMVLLKRAKDGRSFVAALNPMAKWDTKLWTTEKFARLADRLIEYHDTAVVFTGGPEDAGAIEEIRLLMDHPALNIAGQTGLGELAALYGQVDMVVTTDTGPMHIAAAMKAPVVAIFGPTAPWRTGPFGTNKRVVQTGLDCSPCFKRNCTTRQCMTAITVDQVLTAVHELRPDMR
ncbi:MAG: lipopolysaccharide heptosyltransferase I [Thermodesulfobacteriota bacterium]|nr:lipopolysaccharide heptosyltransferase I [Thermodesulfobacteriota bacterium]